MFTSDSLMILDHPTEQDLHQIIELETQAFSSISQDSPDTIRQRLSTFPEGFVVLKTPDTQRIAGFLSSEIWPGYDGLPPRHYLSVNHPIWQTHSDHGTELYISDAVVAPDLRGRHLGERLLMEGLKRICRQRQRLSSASLIVCESWKQARKLYERLGFREVDRVPAFFGAEGDGIFLRKQLHPLGESQELRLQAQKLSSLAR